MRVVSLLILREKCSNLLSFFFFFRCGSRPYEWGIKWDSNSLVLYCLSSLITITPLEAPFLVRSEDHGQHFFWAIFFQVLSSSTNRFSAFLSWCFSSFPHFSVDSRSRPDSCCYWQVSCMVRVWPIQLHFVLSICLAIESCPSLIRSVVIFYGRTNAEDFFFKATADDCLELIERVLLGLFSIFAKSWRDTDFVLALNIFCFSGECS